MGLLDQFTFSRLKEGLAKTRDGLVGGITRLVSSRGTLDQATMDELEEVLIRADVGMETATAVIHALQNRMKDERPGDTRDAERLVREVLQAQLTDRPAADDVSIRPDGGRPHVVLVVGINGVGKTTTIGKMAHRYISAGKKVCIGAADTFRAAANEQLEVWAQRAGAEIIVQARGSDPAAVAFDAVRAAMARSADVVIIDTAGRLHTKVNLMEELRKIKRVIQKHSPEFPHEVLLVIDASTGQNGIQQAKQFHAAVGLTGIVLTKLDGTAKGGIVFAITRALNVPVRFVGVGERIDDLQPFDRQAFVEALFAS
jgi:fused signal recognition particle receptor